MCGKGFKHVFPYPFLVLHETHSQTVGPANMIGLIAPSDDSLTGWLPDGWICLADGQCKSNICCKKRCRQCCTDLDCSTQMEQPPAPGTYGTPFCFKKKHTCTAYKNGVSSQIPASGYPIWVPTEFESELAQVDIKRTVIEGEEPVMEQVLYFDLKEQPVPDVASKVEYNGTHVLLPLHIQMISGYSRTYKMYNESETGIITSVFLPNAVSQVTDKPMAGAAEKIHAITYTSEYSTARGEYIRQYNEETLQSGEDFDLGNFAGRMDFLSVVWALTDIVSMQVDAGIDKVHLWQIRRYSADPEVQLALDPETTEGWVHHRQHAMEAIALSKNATFMETRSIRKSENSCRHFENGTGVGYTDTHIILPVDKPLTMVSGEMATSPMYYLGLNGGYTTVHYDEESQVLQFYYRAYQQFRGYTDVEHQTDNTKPSGIWMSRLASGDDYAVSKEVDGRFDRYLSLQNPKPGWPVGSEDSVEGAEAKLSNPSLRSNKEETLYEASKALRQNVFLEPDLTVFARPIDDTCDSKYVVDDDWKQKWEDIRLAEPGETVVEKLMLSADLIAVSNRGAPCGGTYLRNDYGNDTHYFGINEFGVWIHMLLEVDQGNTRIITTADWWDEWECFYTGKDPSLCKP